MLFALMLLATDVDPVQLAFTSRAFSPDAAITVAIDPAKRFPDEVYVGPDQVRDFSDSYLGGWTATVAGVKSEGEKYSATWTVSDDRFRKLGIDKVELGVSAMVREGKIRSLTLTPDAASSARLIAEIPQANKAVVRTFIDGVNSRHYEVLDEIVGASFLQHSYIAVAPGAEGLHAFYKDFSAAFPDFHFTIDDVIAEGDRVSTRITARYTHKGTFMGIAPTGRPVVVVKFDIFRFQGGKCIEHWDSVDRLGLLQQLGVVPNIPRWSTQGYDSFR